METAIESNENQKKQKVSGLVERLVKPFAHIPKLEEIGFYTLEDFRAENVSIASPLWRCELILTDTCNFKCPYCRQMQDGCRGSMTYDEAREVIDLWAKEGLVNVRLSGGEPTTWKPLLKLVKYIKTKGVKRIALSSNGSAPADYYKELVDAGVNDFSISLDACCSSTGDNMAGVKGKWQVVVDNIRMLSKLTYVTVGVVITPENLEESMQTIRFAHNLGVADIRIISSAQFNGGLDDLLGLEQALLESHPILKYRLGNMLNFRNVRGLEDCDTNKCFLVQDDMAIAGNKHFPCIIYFREGGAPVGTVGPNMRQERLEWFKAHNTKKDAICAANCLDVCIDYNNKVAKCQGHRGHEA